MPKRLAEVEETGIERSSPRLSWSRNQECADMTTRSIKALALGFCAVALSTLPALAEDCKWSCGAVRADCAALFGPEYSAVRAETADPRNLLKDCRATNTLCCRVPVTKTAPVSGACDHLGNDYHWDANAGGGGKGKCVKNASTTTPPSRDPALDCPSKKYDYTAKRCIDRPVKNIGKAKNGESSSTGETAAALKPIRDCKAKGWRWETSGKCVKPSEVKADCEAKGHQYDIDTGRCVKSIKRTEQTSDESDDKPKNKKKKKQHDDDDDDDDDGDRY
jgi:hypothetical protein